MIQPSVFLDEAKIRARVTDLGLQIRKDYGDDTPIHMVAVLKGAFVFLADLVDTGLTLHYLQEILHARGPKSVKTACLLSKPSRRKVEVPVEYIGFTIEDRFVIGYGLDYDERYRQLPYIGVMDGK
jgi:hypoxanthine-guanine phosphoribosyltransferase